MRREGFHEANESVGYGQTGPAEGLAFYPGTNSVIFVVLDDEHVARVSAGESLARRSALSKQAGHLV